MARSTFEDLSGSILGLIVIGLLLLLALIITPLFLIGVVVYVFFRLYRDSSCSASTSLSGGDNHLGRFEADGVGVV